MCSGKFRCRESFSSVEKATAWKKAFVFAVGGSVSCGYGGNFCIFVIEPGIGSGEFTCGREN